MVRSLSILSPPEQSAQQEAQVEHRGPTTICSRLKSRAFIVSRTVVHHLKRHVGVGIICSVAYFDPGNWSVDLQAGSSFGYRPMLFVILMAGLGAVVLQSLAYRLGCVTGLDLASHCRILLYDRPRHRRLIRYCALYPLYALSEIAIISTDLAELLGSAIALCLLIPTLPLWVAVLITAADVLIFLVLGDPSRSFGRPVKVFEWTVIILVIAVFMCFLVLLIKVNPHWGQAFFGYIPSKKLFETDPDALYTAVGILGATVMPHALFLGSYLATQDRVASALPSSPVAPGTTDHQSNDLRSRFRNYIASLFTISRAERIAASRDYLDKYGRENNELSFVRAHLSHGLVDVITSLLGLAVPVNSAILIIAATVFFDSNSSTVVSAGLFDAYDLIKERISQGAALIFAIALLCSGQTASITATLAGQIVSEGFIEWRVSPFLRRIITRLIGLVPSMVVAIAVGRPGINTLLIASQVVLSIVLPFVAFPLIWLTSSDSVMSVRKPSVPMAEEPRQPVTADDGLHREDDTSHLPSLVNGAIGIEKRENVTVGVNEEKRQEIVIDVVEDNRSIAEEEWISFANGRIVTILSYMIFLIIFAANVYVIVMLGLGKTN